MFSKNILPGYPWRNNDIDQAELFSSKVRALDLLRELSLRIIEFLTRSVLLFYALCLEKTIPSWNDRLRRVVDPQACVRALKWIGGEEVRLMVRVSLLKELAQDERLVKSLALVLDCGDEALGVDICARVMSGR